MPRRPCGAGGHSLQPPRVSYASLLVCCSRSICPCSRKCSVHHTSTGSRCSIMRRVSHISCMTGPSPKANTRHVLVRAHARPGCVLPVPVHASPAPGQAHQVLCALRAQRARARWRNNLPWPSQSHLRCHTHCGRLSADRRSLGIGGPQVRARHHGGHQRDDVRG